MEIELRDEELKRDLETVEQKLKELDGLHGSAKRGRVGDIDDLIATCERNVKHIELECRTISTDLRPKYKIIIKEHKATIKQLKQDLTWAKTTDAKGAESGGAAQDANAMSNDEFMEYGKKVQQESLESTDRTLERIEQTKMTGAETAAKVHEQTQQIQRIYDELYEIDDMLQRATRIVKRMLRRTFTDKYMWCFLFLIVAAIITIIALKATGYGENLETSVDGVIENPNGN